MMKLSEKIIFEVIYGVYYTMGYIIISVSCKISLEALAVDDSGARFVILFLGDPHSLESGERGQDRATDPD